MFIAPTTPYDPQDKDHVHNFEHAERIKWCKRVILVLRVHPEENECSFYSCFIAA